MYQLRTETPLDLLCKDEIFPPSKKKQAKKSHKMEIRIGGEKNLENSRLMLQVRSIVWTLTFGLKIMTFTESIKRSKKPGTPYSLV